MKYLRKKQLLVAIQMSMFAVSGIALAQEQVQEPSESSESSAQPQVSTMDAVQVTGSRIRGADMATQNPIFTLSRADIQAQGMVSTDDILQHVVGLTMEAGRSQTGTEDGKATISLRNLGARRTLVLVNGKRWLAGLDGSVDLTTIPASIIERVEVLKDGASTIYGSDAIAGVINIITASKFDGMEANFYYGAYDKGDGVSRSFDFTGGASNDRTSLVYNLSYQEADPVYMRDRDISRMPNYGFPGVGFSGYSTRGVAVLDDGRRLVLNPGATFDQLDQYHLYDSAIDGVNPNDYSALLQPVKRTSAFAQLTHDISDNVRFKSDVLYNQRRSSQLWAPAVTAQGTNAVSQLYCVFSGCGWNFSGDSYYNPFGEDIGVIKRFGEMQRQYQQVNDMIHLSAGLEGVFAWGNRNFNWDVNYSYNRASNAHSVAGSVDLIRMRQAMGPSFMDTDGVVRCGTPGAVISGCVPLNILQWGGGITQEMLDYISYLALEDGKFRSTDFSANLAGELFELPAGWLRFAAGYEYRKEHGSRIPDQLIASNESTISPYLPTIGGFALEETYAELSVPVLAETSPLGSLSLSLAARNTDYEIGDTTNKKFGFLWRPMETLSVRGNYSEGFRAASILERFGGQSGEFAVYADPCDMVRGMAAFDVNVRNNCVAAGVPAGYEQLTEGYGSMSSRQFTTGSNEFAAPETSVTKTLGLVYSPGWLPGLDLALDWYQIRVEDILVQMDATTVLKQCYALGNPEACAKVRRDPATGMVTEAMQIFDNAGWAEVEGYDFDVQYRLPETSLGNFRLSLNGSYTSRYDSQLYPDQNVGGQVGYKDVFRLRANSTLSWSRGGFAANWTVRYLSSSKVDCNAPDYNGSNEPGAHCNRPHNFDPVVGERPVNRMGAVAYHDVQGSMDLPWQGARLSVGINNLMDKEPSVSYLSTRNFETYYDLPGRFYYVRLTQKF